MTDINNYSKPRIVTGSTNIQRILPEDTTVLADVIDRPLTLHLPIFEGDIDGKIIRIKRIAGNHKISILSDKPLVINSKCKKSGCNSKRNNRVTSLPVDDIVTLLYSSVCDSWFTI